MKNIEQFIEEKKDYRLDTDKEGHCIEVDVLDLKDVKQLLSLIAEEFRVEDRVFELREDNPQYSLGKTMGFQLLAKEQNKKSDQLIEIIK